MGISCDNGKNLLSKKVLDWLPVKFEITLRNLAEESKMSYFKKTDRCEIEKLCAEFF